jgi:predicted HD phosphohydrolase
MSERSRLYELAAAEPGIVMGDDDRLPAMPAAPTLMDFFKLRFAPADHLLQSARLARQDGQSEVVQMACLLHDIAVIGYLRGDHGYYGEALVAPYVDESISWSIRTHQALRFFPDETVGYEYPELYVKAFGEDYQPDPYIIREYEAARNHRYYGTARAITLYDIYSFNPNIKVELDEFTDLIGRHFRQPKEGLGFDNTSASHLWRTIRRPNKFL